MNKIMDNALYIILNDYLDNYKSGLLKNYKEDIYEKISNDENFYEIITNYDLMYEKIKDIIKTDYSNYHFVHIPKSDI